MSDTAIIAEARAELFEGNERDVTQGYYRAVVIPALLRRIDELEAALSAVVTVTSGETGPG